MNPASWRDETDVEEGAATPERLLLYLLKHPLQRRADLALALNVPSSTTARHLSQLEEQALIEQIKPALGGLPQPAAWYYLTTKGLQAVALLVGADAGKLATVWGADEAHLLRLLPRLPAWLLWQEVLNGLIRGAPAVLSAQGTTSLLRWHWVRHYQHAFIAKGKRLQCQADAVLALAQHPAPLMKGEQEQKEPIYFSCFVLLDTGLVGPRDPLLIQERLQRLLRWRESRERWQHYQQFPPVLVITHSSRGRETWQWCAQEAALRERVAPLSGAVLSLSEAAATQIHSTWSLAWQRLSPPGVCQVRDLLIAQPRAAVPPQVLAPRVLPAGIFAPATSSPTGKTHLVKGQFTQRAQAWASQPAGKDAKTTEQAALAWLSLTLRRSHLEILLQLYAHPLLSVQEVGVLIQIQSASIRRFLSDLRQWECISSHQTRQGTRLSLGPRGLRWLAAHLSVGLAHVAAVTRQTKPPSQDVRLIQRGLPAPSHLKHTVGIYRFVLRLERVAQSHHDHRLLWWETGARCARRYRFGGRWHNLLPDALLAYQAGEHVQRAWVEWDEGTMNARDLTIKLSAYRTFVLSRQWLNEAAFLPALLFVVPDPGQEGRVQRVARTLMQEIPLHTLTTTATRLAAYGPLGAIWLPLGFDEQGHDAQRRRWTESVQGEENKIH